MKQSKILFRLLYNQKIWFLILLCFSVWGKAQEGGDDDEMNPQIDYEVDMFPKTPEAAMLSKFIDIPSGNYTGVADFSIPLYTIETDGISIPIELKYSTSGVKVGDIASRVGLGWVLDVGPSLSQQVMGARDYTLTKPIVPNNLEEIPELPLDPNNEDDPYFIGMQATDPSNEYLNFPGVPVVDLKPDIFNYSLLNISGKYILDAKKKTGIPMPYNQTKITHSDIYRVNMVDEQGIKYFFHDDVTYNRTKTDNNCASKKVMTAENAYSDPDFKILKITTLKNKEIHYEYGKGIEAHYINSVVENKLLDKSPKTNPGIKVPDPEVELCYNYTSLKDNILTKISFEEGEVQLVYSTIERKDLPGDVYLTGLIVKNKSGDIIKNYSFEYGYFESTPFMKNIYMPLSEKFTKGLDKRLKLEKVKDNLTNSNHQLFYYESYNGKSLPNRISFDQDFWGVFNGKVNSTGSKPTSTPTTKVNLLNAGKVKLYRGANKQPDINYGRLGNLKRIQYPTGGYTEIEYEADDFIRNPGVPPIYEYELSDEDSWVNSMFPEKTFTIPEGAFEQKIKVTSNNPSDTEQAGGYCAWSLYDAQNQHIAGGNVSDTFEFSNPPGQYKLKMVAGNLDGFRECNADYYWINEIIVDDLPTRKAGTIRVSKIESFDNNNGKITREFTYVDPATQVTSGKNLGTEIFRAISIKKVPHGSNGVTQRRLYLSNNPGWQTSTIRGKAVGYDYVQEKYISHDSPSISYRKEYTFQNDFDDQWAQYNPYGDYNFTWPVEGLNRGFLLREKEFDAQNNLVKEVEKQYQEDTRFNVNSSAYQGGLIDIAQGLEVNLTGIMDGGIYTYYIFEIARFPIKNFWITDTVTITKEYLPTGIVESRQSTIYGNHLRHTYPFQKKMKNSLDETLKVEYRYPQDLTSNYQQSTIMSEMVNRNMLSRPITTKTYNNNTPTSEQRTLYKNFSGLILPEFIYAKKGQMSTNVNAVDRKITYDNYDVKGNLLQYTLENGTPVSIIWGYNGQYPIAKVEGATYSQISSQAQTLINLSNSGNLVKTSFDTLRNIEHAMVAGYIYKPLVGVTTVVQPNGQVEYYEYDTAGRLEKIKDQDGKVIKEMKYHYKN